MRRSDDPRLNCRRRRRHIPILSFSLAEEASSRTLLSERSGDPVLRERVLSHVTADIRHPARLNARRRASDAATPRAIGSSSTKKDAPATR